MADLLGGNTQVINQTAGSGGIADFLKKLGDVGLSFTGDNKTDLTPEEALNQFIDSILGGNSTTTATTASTLAPSSSLGPVAERLLTPRAGAAPSGLGLVQDRLMFPNLGGPQLPPIFNPIPGSQGGLLGDIQKIIQPPSIFKTQPF